MAAVSTPITITLHLGEQTLQCYGTATLGEPAITSGPPEHCDPGSPDELEIEAVFLEVAVTEDLGLNAGKRTVEVDITDMLVELEVFEQIEERAYERFDWSSLTDPFDGDPDEYDPS
jgi:hypothetical protein